VRSRLVATLVLVAAPALAGAAASAFPVVGPESCKACHPAAYEAWRTGPHARAFDSLPERSRKDKRCLSCHAPLADEGAVAVGCESCHGAGGAYSAPYVMRDPELARAVGLVDPGEKGCAACHNESTPSLTKFDYARKLPLIEHGKAERAAWAEPPPPDARKGAAAGKAR
jgi:hypothetical protein